MNTGTKGRRAWSGLLWLALAAAGCWSGGAVAQNSSGAIPDGRGRVVALAAGSFHNCALRSDGSVACWGSNWTGESTAPSRGHFTAVAAGYFHSCGLHSDGSVECWGGSTSVRAVPAGERFTAIASGTAALIDPMAVAILDEMAPRAYLTDSHASNFTSNILTLLLELDAGLALFDPAGVLKVTFNGTT